MAPRPGKRASAILAGTLWLAVSACGPVEPSGEETAGPGEATVISVEPAPGHVVVHPAPKEDEDPSLLRGRDGAFWMVWFSKRSGNPDIWMTRSIDGTEWETPWPVVSKAGADFCPSVSQSPDGRFHVAWFWQVGAGGKKNIFYTRGDTNGRNWSEPLAITDAPTADWVPSILADAGGTIWIAWCSESTGNKDIFLARSDNGGKTWPPPRQVTSHPDQDDFPALAQDGSGEYLLVWTRHHDPDRKSWLPNATSEVMWSRSPDGAAWSDPVAITRDKWPDLFPTIVVDPARESPFVVWTSNRYSKDKGDLVAAPLTDTEPYPAQLSRLTPPGTHGYFGRLAPTDTDGHYLTVWVSRTAEGDLDIFRLFVEF